MCSKVENVKSQTLEIAAGFERDNYISYEVLVKKTKYGFTAKEAF